MHSAGKARGFVIVFILILLAPLVRRDEASKNDYGYTPDPAGTARFLRELEQPLFADAGKEVVKNATGKETLLYRAAYAAHEKVYGKPWIVGKQGIGDCVSWAWAHSAYIGQSVDWEQGELSDPPLFPATESIYGGSRVEARGKDGSGRSAVGGYSDGSYGGAAARWLRDWGVVYREPQPNGIDLTTYSSSRAKEWGAYGNGGKGDNSSLDEQAKKHPAENVALVRSFDEAAAAIESGYPVAVCSSVGFSSQRDSAGFSKRSGTWLHAMTFCAVRYDNGRPGLLCLNSWGPSWNRGGKYPDDQPDGSFWVDKATVDLMLRGGDSFAVGGVQGFRWRDLSHEEWLNEVQR